MEYREIGKPKTRVSVICLGAWEFGQTDAWGPGEVGGYKKIIDYALDAGINFIDTAERYGKSEEIIGKFLKGRRNQVILATKVWGFRWDYNEMRGKLEESLRKLQTDYVDIYMIHWPRIKGLFGNTSDMEDKDYKDIYNSLNRLKNEKFINLGAVSNFRLHHLKKFRDEAFDIIAANQVPYNLLWRGFDEPYMSSFCLKKSLRYLTYSSLAQGLLTGKYGESTALAPIQKGNVLFNEPVYGRAMKVIDTLRDVGNEVDATPAQVALKWVIDRELTISALVGVRRIKEIEENVEAVSLHLTREQVDRLNKVSLDFWAPMPPGLEWWIPNNKQNISSLEKIGITWRNADYFKTQ